MNVILGIVVLIAGGSGLAALARHDRARRPGARRIGPRRPAWLVTAARSAGVPLTSDHLSGAVAELAGRAAGGTTRAGGRGARWAGRGAARTARRHGPGLYFQAVRLAAAVRDRWGTPQGLVTVRPDPDARPGAPAVPVPVPAAGSPEPNGTEPPGTRRVGAGHPLYVPIPDPSAPAPQEAPVTVTTTPPASAPGGSLTPGDHATTISRVAGFEPESDDDLLMFMQGECAGMCGYSDAMRELLETCTTGMGLDPAAVQGLAEYADAVSEAAASMAQAHQRFAQVYAQVREAVAAGVVLPHNGRFFTAESA